MEGCRRRPQDSPPLPVKRSPTCKSHVVNWNESWRKPLQLLQKVTGGAATSCIWRTIGTDYRPPMYLESRKAATGLAASPVPELRGEPSRCCA